MRILTAGALLLGIHVLAAAGQSGGERWTARFDVNASDLGPTGRSDYFILEPGQSSTYEDGDERLVITVLDQTKQVDGVTARIVEERETKGGRLVEVSRNYFAISAKSRDVFYFGEQVDIYRDGKVVDHEGAWISGENGARFGLMMPGQPKLSDRYYQELAPKVAMDRAAIVSLHAVVKTPAGEFKDCLKIEETTPLEPRAREYKYYAPGVGLVQDGSLKLVKGR
jgi:hypothetical protein